MTFNLGLDDMKRRTQRKGAAAVEFAVIAPVMFLVVFGMFELGRAMSIQQVLTNAAREGAREAILPGSTEDSVDEIVDNYVAGLNIGSVDTATSVAPESAESGDLITVTVTTDKTTFTQYGARWFGGEDYELSASTTMRKEGF